MTARRPLRRQNAFQAVLNDEPDHGLPSATYDTLRAIAASLNAGRIQTAHKGKQWYPSTVSAVLRSEAA